MAIVELRNVSKIYQMEKVAVKAVDNVSFTIEAGNFCAISGPSGSGKSTLLNLIGLTDLPSAGSVILNGIDIYDGINLSKTHKIPLSIDSKLTDLRRNLLGFIFQTFNLIPVLNVYENISIPLHLGDSPALQNMSKKEQNEWVDYLIETVGLTDWKKHRPSELSGGQRQRVAIARALVTKCPVILADEPTANLDSTNGDQILTLMKKINDELKTTFIFSTHDQKIVNMANQVIKIRDGKLAE
ncbi:MAG: ABC transporter ATP-binding protein [Treponema sp.]|nr:ABC transporter ATP-binding protein [Treponema sp.]MDY3722169.1 ABC transporter ATP-binding protein [Treponema sp.]MDY5757775.1 ABC transporter ATP-binding protein [Treponema sp.]MDY5816946.1 ABC transporter ATP-binding protein [Treponema sp.]